MTTLRYAIRFLLVVLGAYLAAYALGYVFGDLLSDGPRGFLESWGNVLTTFVAGLTAVYVGWTVRK